MKLRQVITARTTLAVLAGLAIGLPAGIGFYTFVYAKGYSYMTNDPAACANCHIMEDHYSAWLKGSHHQVATCNDCHTPPGLIPKYITKAQNGFWHSFYFTTGNFPDPLQITERNKKITEQACRKCHSDIVAAIEAPAVNPANPHKDMGKVSCVKCHVSVGHLQ